VLQDVEGLCYGDSAPSSGTPSAHLEGGFVRCFSVFAKGFVRGSVCLPRGFAKGLLRFLVEVCPEGFIDGCVKGFIKSIIKGFANGFAEG
jgi:hypothetical protein